jgi:general secretion pathway protein M
LPTGRRGRLLALLLLLVALSAAYLAAAVPLLDLYAHRRTQLEDGRTLLPRLQAKAEELPALRARLAELSAAAGAQRVTLDGASDAIASAALQSRIEALAAAVGATIASTESLPAEPRGGYRRIGLRFVLNGPYQTLIQLLAKLEAASPPLVVDNLQIHGVLRRPGLQAGPADPGLDATLDVFGFRGDETPQAGKS